MKKLIAGFMLGALLTSIPAWAGLIPSPPGTVEREVRSYFSQIYHNWMELPTVSTEPDGTRQGKLGDMLMQDDGVTRYFQVCVSGGPGLGTVWRGVRLMDTSAGFTVPDVTIYTPSTAQVIDAVGDTVLANATTIVLDPDGNYTLTSTPTIADGTQGQLLIITCSDSEANSVTVQDEGSLVGSNLQLGAASRVIGALDTLILRMGTTTWNEVGYVDN